MSEKNNAGTNAPLANHLSIERMVDAPRALVFKAWTEPEHLQKWCHLGALRTIKMEADVRTGGHWNIDLEWPDGGEITVRRVYREIVEPERIVFYEKCVAGGNVMLDGTHTILLEAVGSKTRITVTCDLAKPFDTENQQGWSGGWGELFDRLAAHLSGA
jgi:uncharacterized protein YndB with AHSA1/START domain